MQAATSLKSLSISSRLSLGFGCMLVLLVAVAAVGQLSVGKVHEQMRQITGIGANKAKLVNGMLESVSAIGIQSRSAAMLNDIDPKQAREQIDAVAKTLKLYATQEAALAELLTPANATPTEIKLLGEVQALGKKTRPELDTAIKAADDGDTVSATLALMTRVAPAETAWRTKLGELIDLQNTLNAEATASAEHTQSQARVVGGLLVLLAIGLGALIAWRITTSITAPLAAPWWWPNALRAATSPRRSKCASTTKPAACSKPSPPCRNACAPWWVRLVRRQIPSWSPARKWPRATWT